MGGVGSAPVEKDAAAAAAGGHPENEKQTTAFCVVDCVVFSEVLT